MYVYKKLKHLCYRFRLIWYLNSYSMWKKSICHVVSLPFKSMYFQMVCDKYCLKSTTAIIMEISQNKRQMIFAIKKVTRNNKKSAEGVIAPAEAKVTGATIRMWLLNKFISFLAVLS